MRVGERAAAPGVAEVQPRKRRRRDSLKAPALPPSAPLPSTNPDSMPSSSHLAPTRRIETVLFSGFEIQTWYSSPYPLDPAASAVEERRGGKGKAVDASQGPAHAQAAEGEDPMARLCVCEGCFKYMQHPAALTAHKKSCAFKHPPGRKVYQRGAHIIWEVDGSDARLYCQNLCLFGKLFLDHKYVFFDVEGFKFYVLTDATPSFDFVIGFFSKEKVSYDEYNLACIITFPPYQKKGYGTLLIEFSYELSRRSASQMAGTPERPLSDLGLRGYLSFWTSVLVRYFQAVFELQGEPPAPGETDEPGAEEREKQRKRWRGWQGGPGEAKRVDGASSSPAKTPGRQRTVTPGSTSVHLPSSPLPHDFKFPTSLRKIARATNLREEDAAFALVESGLAQWRQHVGGPPTKDAEGEMEERLLEIIVTPALVEEVARARNVKRAVMEHAYVLL